MVALSLSLGLFWLASNGRDKMRMQMHHGHSCAMSVTDPIHCAHCLLSFPRPAPQVHT